MLKVVTQWKKKKKKKIRLLANHFRTTGQSSHWQYVIGNNDPIWCAHRSGLKKTYKQTNTTDVIVAHREIKICTPPSSSATAFSLPSSLCLSACLSLSLSFSFSIPLTRLVWKGR